MHVRLSTTKQGDSDSEVKICFGTFKLKVDLKAHKSNNIFLCFWICLLLFKYFYVIIINDFWF